MYGGAALVGVSRMYENRHWASDVIMGAAIGTFAGTKVVRYHRTHPDNRTRQMAVNAVTFPIGPVAHLVFAAFLHFRVADAVAAFHEAGHRRHVRAAAASSRHGSSPFKNGYDPRMAAELPPHITITGSSGMGPIAPETTDEELRRALEPIAQTTSAVHRAARAADAIHAEHRGRHADRPERPDPRAARTDQIGAGFATSSPASPSRRT